MGVICNYMYYIFKLYALVIFQFINIQFQKILEEVGRIVKTANFSIKTFVHTSKHLKSAEIDNNESSTIVT